METRNGLVPRRPPTLVGGERVIRRSYSEEPEVESDVRIVEPPRATRSSTTTSRRATGTVATAPATGAEEVAAAPRARVVQTPPNRTEVRIQSTPPPERRSRTVITRRGIFDGDNDDD
jgi:hypothetical protein